MNNKWFFIINPTSGSGKAKKDWQLVSALLHKYEVEFDFHFSEYEKHALLLTENAIASGYKKICGLGGDGTMHEIANAVLKQKHVDPTEILLGIIPVGTGNDWARQHQLPFQYEAAVINLKKEKSVLSDVIEVQHENGIDYSIIVAGCGFEGYVSEKANAQKRKGKGGKLIYMIELLKGVFNYKSVEMSWNSLDGSGVGKIFSVAVGNLACNGGGMMQCPLAKPNDGLLDVTIIKHLTVPQVFANVPRLFNGTILKNKRVQYIRTKQIELKAANCLLELDGENYGLLPARFTAVADAIRVLVG